MLETLDEYRQTYLDVNFWRPLVAEIVARCQLGSAQTVRTGVPGTYPTFIVDERWVVKFFGRLFDGGRTFALEREANRLVATCPAIKAPALVADGFLLEDTQRQRALSNNVLSYDAPSYTVDPWPWPYLVFAFVPGQSIGELYPRVSKTERLALARELGVLVRQIHELPLDRSTCFSPAWDSFGQFLQKQYQQCPALQREWGTLPKHWLAQLDGYLLPPTTLIDRQSVPHLIHADLTADHVLGHLVQDRWQTLGLIDFGDGMVGNLTYELVALHLDCFRCDKTLLATFLDAYGLDAESRLRSPQHAMSMALLHRFNVVSVALARFPHARHIPTLDQFAARLWDLSTPGLA